jgi:hypothetical protein
MEEPSGSGHDELLDEGLIKIKEDKPGFRVILINKI